MSSRRYTVPYSGTITLSGGDADLLYIAPASNKPVTLRGWIIGQLTQVGDANEKGLRVSVMRLPATVTVGSGGSSVTPQPLDGVAAAAGFTARCNDATLATTSGSPVTLMELGWNERGSPWEEWFPDSDWCPTVRNAEALVVRLQTAVAADAAFQMTFFLEEH